MRPPPGASTAGEITTSLALLASHHLRSGRGENAGHSRGAMGGAAGRISRPLSTLSTRPRSLPPVPRAPRPKVAVNFARRLLTGRWMHEIFQVLTPAPQHFTRSSLRIMRFLGVKYQPLPVIFSSCLYLNSKFTMKWDKDELSPYAGYHAYSVVSKSCSCTPRNRVGLDLIFTPPLSLSPTGRSRLFSSPAARSCGGRACHPAGFHTCFGAATALSVPSSVAHGSRGGNGPSRRAGESFRDLGSIWSLEGLQHFYRFTLSCTSGRT